MNRNRLIFFVVFGLYHLAIVLLAYYTDGNKENVAIMWDLYNLTPFLKYPALIGLVLFFTDLIWSWGMLRNAEAKQLTLQAEVNALKAELYDFQKTENPTSPEPSDEMSEEKIRMP